MPNMFGGSSSDKDYAPHMWIGDFFVGSKTKFTVGDNVYITGVSNNGPVAECDGKILVGDEVPAAVQQSAYAEQTRRANEIKGVQTLIENQQ